MAYIPNPRLDQVYILAAIWAETLVYGFYACLFILGMYVLTKPSPTAHAPRERTSVSSKIFFGALWLMFLNATFHIIVQMYRLIRGYGFIISPNGTPIGYISQVPQQWDGIINPILMGMQIWFGDALAIYRCYIIWGHNFWIVIVPILLALAAMGVNLTLYSWFPKPWTPYPNMVPVINAGYPLAFTQNVLTTGLIAWKIWRQHRLSKKSGLRAANRISLLQVIRIIVESAMVYTFQVLALVILYFVGHPLQFVFQALIVPTSGIVFVLIAIRVHLATTESQNNTMASSIIPPWLSDQEPVFVTHPSYDDTDSSGSNDNRSLQLLAQDKNSKGLFAQQGAGQRESEPKAAITKDV